MADKHIIHLVTGDNRKAVVIEESIEAAKQRVYFHDPSGNWENVTAQVLGQVRTSMTVQVLALEK